MRFATVRNALSLILPTTLVLTLGLHAPALAAPKFVHPAGQKSVPVPANRVPVQRSIRLPAVPNEANEASPPPENRIGISVALGEIEPSGLRCRVASAGTQAPPILARTGRRLDSTVNDPSGLA